MQPGGHKFMRETRLIRAFKKPGTKYRVDINRGPDDSLRYVFMQHGNMTSVPSVSSVVKPLDKQSAVQARCP